MATVLQQILDQLDVVLQANAPAGCTVYRERVDAESLAEAPSINALPQEDQAESWDGMDKHVVMVDLDFYVRAEPGAMAAEDLHAAVHGPIVRDATLKALCESVRLEGGPFERAEADTTATHKKARYRFIYLIPQNTL